MQLLLDGQASQAAIRQALTDLTAHSDQDSTVFFYISSHGERIETGAHAGEYLLPVDTVYTSDRLVAQTVTSGAEFTEALRALSASDDRTLKVWDLETGQELATITLEGTFYKIALAPDGATILAGDAAGNVYCLRYVEGDKVTK